jgi:hypothetical protein
MKMRKSFVILFLLVGCAGDFHQLDQGSPGYSVAMIDAPVKVNVNHSLDTNNYKTLAYVSIQMHGVSNWHEYQDYIMESVKKMGFFSQVITREPTVFINHRAFEPTKIVEGKPWLDVDNHIPYESLLRSYGNHFLILDVELYNKSTDPEHLNTYAFELKMIEPSSQRVLMTASVQNMSKDGIDKAVINPVMNYTLGYLNFYDSTYPKPTPEPKTWYEWWEQLNEDFVNAMFV